MSRLEDIGDRAGWRCWLCDEPVDPAMSVNDPRGPSVDNLNDRLAHRACNTKKGAVAPVVPWADHLFVVDPAPIIAVVGRLERKGGREIVARCPTEGDAREAADWVLDRLSRLAPDLAVSAAVEPGGGQYLLALTTARR